MLQVMITSNIAHRQMCALQ